MAPILTPLPEPPPRWVFIRTQRGSPALLLYDPIVRVWQALTNFPLTDPVAVVTRNGLVLASGLATTPALYNLGLGAYDPLRELLDAASGERADLDGSGTVIAYTAGPPGKRRVQLFDRRLRVINVLSRLNVADETFDPTIDAAGRWLACVTRQSGQQDLMLYDTLTGLTDPLPEINSPANESHPALEASGRFLAYIASNGDPPAVRLFDRQLGGIDTLPGLNGLGAMTRVQFSADGRQIVVAFQRDGHQQTAAYDRATGFIDPLRELNQPGSDVTF